MKSQSDKSEKKLSQKVIFIRVDEDLYNKLSAAASEQDRTINSLSIHLLRKALKQLEPEA